MTVPAAPVQHLLDRVTDLCESTFATVEAVRAAAEQLVLPLSRGTPLHRADVDPIADVLRPVLEAAGTPLVGAGLVLAPGVLDDEHYWMEWWFGGGDGASRMQPVLDPSADSFYDYTVLPWFAIPRETGARHVTGPYVDWLCTEDYTLTFTVPLFGTHPERGRCYLGVVGADIVNSWVERRLLPLLHRTGRRAALVNAEGRVVVANDPALVTGSVTRRADVPALWAGQVSGDAALHRLPGLPLAVLVLTDGITDRA